MEYWTIKDGHHAGPFSAMQLADMGIMPDTPVWHEGLPDWVPASQIAEISAIMVARQNAPQPMPAPAAPQPVYASHAPLRPEPQGAPAPAPGEECPPVYLGWSIVAMLLCCMPLGVLAIIFSAQVRPAWRSGNIAKARRASERAQWCIILTMSVGLVPSIFCGVFRGAAGI